MSVRIYATIRFPIGHLKELQNQLDDIMLVEAMALTDDFYNAHISLDASNIAKFLNVLAQYNGDLLHVDDDNSTSDIGVDAVRTMINKVKSNTKTLKASTEPVNKSAGRKRRVIARLTRKRSQAGNTIKDRLRAFLKTGWKTYDDIKGHVGDAKAIHARMHELDRNEKCVEKKIKPDGTKLFRYKKAA